jgi:hypothetical protein
VYHVLASAADGGADAAALLATLRQRRDRGQSAVVRSLHRKRYEIRVDGEVFTLDAPGAVVADGAEPDLVVTAPARAWIDIRQHHAGFDDLLRSGVVTCAGSDEVLAHFRAVYRLGDGTDNVDTRSPPSQQPRPRRLR